MNSYERIYNVLMEEALVIEQKKGRARLMATAGVLGALTAGLQGTGKTKAPDVARPSTTQTVASKRKAPELPSMRKPISKAPLDGKKIVDGLKKRSAPEKTETTPKAPTTKNLGPSRSNWPTVVPYRDDGPESDMDQRERSLKLYKSIDQKQAKIDFDKRHKKWKGIPYK